MKKITQESGGLRTVHLNRRKAIRAKCRDCRNLELKQIRNCAFTECQLHWLRTGQGYQDPKERDRSIRDYCLAECMNGQLPEVALCPSKHCSLYPYRKARVDRSIECSEIVKKEHIGVPREITGTPRTPKIGLEGESISP